MVVVAVGRVWQEVGAVGFLPDVFATVQSKTSLWSCS